MEHAEANAINLDACCMVWSLDFEASPVLCGKNKEKGFADASQAWAHQHTRLKRIVVTGHEGDTTPSTQRIAYVSKQRAEFP